MKMKNNISQKKKNSRTKIDDEFTRRPLCWKSQKIKLKKNFEQFKTIIYEAVDKKDSKRFSRNSTDFSSVTEEFIKNNFKNKKTHFSHYRNDMMICITNDLTVKDTNSFLKKQIIFQKLKRSIEKKNKKLYHINNNQIKSWSKANVNIFWHKNAAYRRLKKSNESASFATMKQQLSNKSKKTIIKNKKSNDKNEAKFNSFFKKLFDNAAAKFVFEKNMIIKNKSPFRIDLFQKFVNEKKSWNEIETKKISKINNLNINREKRLKNIINTSKKKFKLILSKIAKFIENNRIFNQQIFAEEFSHIAKNFVNYKKEFEKLRERLYENFYFSSSIQFKIILQILSYLFFFDHTDSSASLLFLRSKILQSIHQFRIISKMTTLRQMMLKTNVIFDKLTNGENSALTIKNWNRTIRDYSAVQTNVNWAWIFRLEKTVEKFFIKKHFSRKKKTFLKNSAYSFIAL